MSAKESIICLAIDNRQKDIFFKIINFVGEAQNLAGQQKTDNNMNLTPLSDNLIVKPLQEEKPTSGIVLPESEKDKPEKGEVVAVGPGRFLDNGNRLPLAVKVGDKVLFRKYAPDEFKQGEQKFLILREPDIIAIIN